MIESVNNEKIKELIKLKDKKYIKEKGKFLIEGKHLIEEAYKNGYLEEVYVLDGETSKYPNAIFVSKAVMNKISSLDTSTNMVGVSKVIDKGTIKGNVLVLDDISDPGNMGTIIRSVVAFNIDTLILNPKCVYLYNSKVIRATEGMIYNLNIIVEELNEILPKLKELGYKIYGTNVIEGTNLKDTVFTSKNAIIIGSEAAGINKDLYKHIDENIHINISDSCESLNAGVATSIILYELSNKKSI